MSESKCRKCRIEMELHVDETPHPHVIGLPTRAYFQCPQCGDTFPTYHEDTEV